MARKAEDKEAFAELIADYETRYQRSMQSVCSRLHTLLNHYYSVKDLSTNLLYETELHAPNGLGGKRLYEVLSAHIAQIAVDTETRELALFADPKVFSLNKQFLPELAPSLKEIGVSCSMDLKEDTVVSITFAKTAA